MSVSGFKIHKWFAILDIDNDYSINMTILRLFNKFVLQMPQVHIPRGGTTSAVQLKQLASAITLCVGG